MLNQGPPPTSTAPERPRNRDNQYAYRHDSDFFYLTGFVEPGAWLILVAGEQDRAILCCLGKHPEREIWDGVRWGPEAAGEHFGFDEARDSERLDDLMPELLVGAERIFAVLTGTQGADLPQRLQRWTQAAAGVSRGARALPAHWTDLSDVIAEMRLIKDATELDTMRRAAAISARGHVRAMQAAYPGCHEYELEAELLYTFRKSGAQSVAYDSIVAAGANACVLHHRAGHAVAHDGDLILIDAGCELDGYASDITRTFPVNGRFSGPQRALYDVVLEAQRAAALHATRAFDFNAGHEAAVRVLAQGMIDLGLIAGSLDAAIEGGAYQRFYMHRTGHWLGMDVHDVGPLGQQALYYTLVAYGAHVLHRRLMRFDLWSQGMHLLPVFLLGRLVDVLAGAWQAGFWPGWTWVISVVLTAALWPAVGWVLLLPQHRMDDVDGTAV